MIRKNRVNKQPISPSSPEDHDEKHNTCRSAPTTTTNTRHQNGRQASTSTTTPNHFITLQSTSHHAEHNRRQFSSFILFLSVVILVNLCPFQQPEFGHHQETSSHLSNNNNNGHQATSLISFLDPGSLSLKTMPSQAAAHLRTCLEFVQLMFRNPIRLGKRTTRFTLAEARMLGKMAKVWYIKKKIKKLSKKLKKHTIAVPLFTAIPIYEHSYYPQPHVTHVSHGPVHHAAAASSYSPTVTQLGAATAPAAAYATGVISAGHQQQQQSQQQQLATSASNQHAAYHRVVPTHHNGGGHSSPHHMFHQGHHHPMMHAAANQIINAYAPSPPLYVDEAGGLYGHYGNAYGRYDGGFQLW